MVPNYRTHPGGLFEEGLSEARDFSRRYHTRRRARDAELVVELLTGPITHPELLGELIDVGLATWSSGAFVEPVVVLIEYPGALAPLVFWVTTPLSAGCHHLGGIHRWSTARRVCRCGRRGRSRRVPGR